MGTKSLESSGHGRLRRPCLLQIQRKSGKSWLTGMEQIAPPRLLKHLLLRAEMVNGLSVVGAMQKA